MQNNFRYLDDLIHSGVKEIILDSDIVLSDCELSKYKDGIELNVDNLTIDGNGHIIDAQGKTRIFYCTGKNITIKNIILKKGYAKKYGGAIYNKGNLTILKTILNKNTAKNGGTIYNEWGELTITESTLNSNTTKSGGVIYNNQGKCSLTNSIFNENLAKWRNGEIIHQQFGKLEISKSTFTQNEANNLIKNITGRLEISNSLFTENIVKNDIIDTGSIMQVHNSTFKRNTSESIILSHRSPSLSKHYVSIHHCKFIDNNVKNVIRNSRGECTIDRTIFDNNLSHSNSINIFNSYGWNLVLIMPQIKDHGKTIDNRGHIIIKNSFPGFERKIYGEGTVEIVEIPKGESFDYGYLDKKIHESKTNEIILDHDITFENYERDFYEGGIELDIDNLIVDGNGKTINGSDKSRIFIITGKNITLKNIVFKNGFVREDPLKEKHFSPWNNEGGAISINSGSSVTIKSCQFEDNTSENGGAISTRGDNLTILETTFHRNVASKNGGTIINHNGELNISESKFLHNKSKINNGGAIYNSGNMMLEKSLFKYNQSRGIGSAIFTFKEITLKNCIIQRNISFSSLLSGILLYSNHYFKTAIFSPSERNIKIINSEFKYNINRAQYGNIFGIMAIPIISYLSLVYFSRFLDLFSLIFCVIIGCTFVDIFFRIILNLFILKTG